MPNRILLRPATTLDSTAIADIYLESRKKFLAYTQLIHTDANIREWIHSLILAKQVTVAQKNDSVAGMMALSENKNIGWIDQLYITPTLVGHGIGSLLIDFAKKKLGSPIQLYTFQENIMAQRFYERHKFNAILFRDASENEEHCPDVLFKWEKNNAK